MKKAAMTIDGVMLRAMKEELAALTKEAEMDKEAIPALAGLAARALPMLGQVGGKVLGVAGKGAKRLGAGKQFGKIRGQLGQAVGGQERLQQIAGGATLGAGALGAAGLASRARRPQPRGY